MVIAVNMKDLVPLDTEDTIFVTSKILFSKIDPSKHTQKEHIPSNLQVVSSSLLGSGVAGTEQTSAKNNNIVLWGDFIHGGYRD